LSTSSFFRQQPPAVWHSCFNQDNQILLTVESATTPVSSKLVASDVSNHLCTAFRFTALGMLACRVRVVVVGEKQYCWRQSSPSCSKCACFPAVITRLSIPTDLIIVRLATRPRSCPSHLFPDLIHAHPKGFEGVHSYQSGSIKGTAAHIWNTLETRAINPGTLRGREAPSPRPAEDCGAPALEGSWLVRYDAAAVWTDG
jgi:hypothetical protein